MFCLLMLCFAFLTPLESNLYSTPIIVEITLDSNLYSINTLKDSVGEALAGDLAEILEDYSAKVYKVKLVENGLIGWISGNSISIPPDTKTDNSILSAGYLESYVNKAGHSSKTNYLLVTDIARQKLYIFNLQDSFWTLNRTFDCSTGVNSSPTTTGIFLLSERGDWFYSNRLGAGAMYWIRFNNQYLVHSVPMDGNRNIIQNENKVGVKMSSGCIRLLLDDAKWLYKTIPDGTTIVII